MSKKESVSSIKMDVNSQEWKRILSRIEKELEIRKELGGNPSDSLEEKYGEKFKFIRTRT